MGGLTGLPVMSSAGQIPVSFMVWEVPSVSWALSSGSVGPIARASPSVAALWGPASDSPLLALASILLCYFDTRFAVGQRSRDETHTQEQMGTSWTYGLFKKNKRTQSWMGKGGRRSSGTYGEICRK